MLRTKACNVHSQQDSGPAARAARRSPAGVQIQPRSYGPSSANANSTFRELSILKPLVNFDPIPMKSRYLWSR
jgi:hypothetical protein